MLFQYQKFTKIEPDTLFEPYIDGERLLLSYIGTIEAAHAAQAAEAVFARHNRDDRPDGQLCPSMSIGDVVVLHDPQGEITTLACDRISWFERERPTNVDIRFWVELLEDKG